MAELLAERPRPRRARIPFGPVLALLLLAGLVFAHAKLSSRPLWTVRRIEVEGNRSIPTAELLRGCELREGMPWWRISTGSAARFRRREPRLASLGISFAWPRDLHLTVRERESCLRILGPPALDVATDGTLLDPCDALDPADLPLLTGSLPASFQAGKRCEFAEAPGWKDLLALNEDAPELWRAISEIHYLGGTDFQIYLRDGRKVIFWETDINRELRRQIPQILGELRDRRVDDAVIDLRFRDQAVVRLPESAQAGKAQGEKTEAASTDKEPRQGTGETPNRRHGA